MPANADKPHLWKADTLESIDFYNDWFLRFAPATYREQRELKTKDVANALKITDNLKSITTALLKANPAILSMLRMATAPPLARDRLVGLAYTSKNLITSMEGSVDKPPRIPPRMAETELDAHLTRIVDVLSEMADRDLFPWLENPAPEPTEAELMQRSASVVADRLCGAAADPIVRNAQERRQLRNIGVFLQSLGYKEIAPGDFDDLLAMPVGAYTFRCNVVVGSGRSPINIPIDCVISKHDRSPEELPILVEAKSAGDATNTNKRRKEEAQKFTQLKQKLGKDVVFILFLCGYFEPGYLGYEASEGIDWIWEHRINDFHFYLGNTGHSPGTDRVGEDDGSYSSDFLAIEAERLRRQKAVDASKTALERNHLGQFSTPFSLASQITSYTVSVCPDKSDLLMLEPACGSGVFISTCIGQGKTDFSFKGVEIDNTYINIFKDLFADYKVEAVNGDFFQFVESEPREQCDLIITNPPYIRHHHIGQDKKRVLQERVRSQLNMEISGLSGLYIYYILLSHSLLKPEGVATWLIPSEFLYTNYGKALREYLTEKVLLLRIHRFDADDVQFDDALVSSCVVTYKKTQRPTGHSFILSTGAYHFPKSEDKIAVEQLRPREKWSFFEPTPTEPNSGVALEDLFYITRGLATGNNAFFILDAEKAKDKKIEPTFLIPLLPSPRELKSQIIEADADGLPCLPKHRFLLSVTTPPDKLSTTYPGVRRYLEEGIQKGVPDGYLCRTRKTWYFQEKREPPLFVATYMGRNGSQGKSPIRFILNRSKGIVTNVFICLYPRPNLQRLLMNDPDREIDLLNALNTISPSNIEKAGRSYGGGLQKIEPKELRSVRLKSLPSWLEFKLPKQSDLFQ
jgi:phospholipid N-methyltransferase